MNPALSFALTDEDKSVGSRASSTVLSEEYVLNNEFMKQSKTEMEPRQLTMNIKEKRKKKEKPPESDTL